MNYPPSIYKVQFFLRQRILAEYCKWLGGRKIVHSSPPEAPQRLLFVLVGLIGDSVMSLPAIMEARRIWPDARLTVLGKQQHRQLLLGSTYIDEFYECRADPFTITERAEVKKLEEWLKSSKFDVAIILLGDQYAHLLARARIPVRVGVRGTMLENCLTHLYDIGSPREWGSHERLNALRVLGCEVEDVQSKINVSEEASKEAAVILRDGGISDDEPYIVVHPFGSTPRQWWPPKRVAELSRRLSQTTGMRSLLIGGPETVASANKITSETLLNMCGRFEISHLLAVINGASLVITTDSGPYHIAGALGKPIVGLFRARRPEHRAAYVSSIVILGEDADCEAYCRWDKCNKEPCAQMGTISTDEIVDKVGLFAPGRAYERIS